MSYKYVIDSSAWAEYFEGTQKGAAIKSIIELDQIATSVIAIAELADKFERESRPFDAPLRFLQSRAAILPITVKIALEAAKIKKQMRSRKPKFGLADGLHLSTAVNEGAKFVTADSDFAGAKEAMLI